MNTPITRRVCCPVFLWQNYSTGVVAFWLMNGTIMQSTVVIGNIPAGWLNCK